MLFYNHGGIFSAIGFAGGRFGAPTLITDFNCTTQSPSYPISGHVLWPAACGTGDGRARLGVFELCGGMP